MTPTLPPRTNIKIPVVGSDANNKNAASPMVAVSTATNDPKLILP